VPTRLQILSELTREATSQKPQQHQQQQQQNPSSSQPKQQARKQKKKKQNKTNKPTSGDQLTTETCFKEKTQIFFDKASSTKLLLV
jgi:hypothetical protein